MAAGSISPPPAGPAAIAPEIKQALGLNDSQFLGLEVAALVAVMTVVVWGRSVVASRLRPAPATVPFEEAPAPDVDALPAGFEPAERQVYSPPPMKAPWEMDSAEPAAPTSGTAEVEPAPAAGTEAESPGQDYMPAFVPPPSEG